MGKVKWNRGKKVEEKIVRGIEERLKVKFPKEYFECVLLNDGGYAEPSCIDVGEKQRVFGGLEENEKIPAVLQSLEECLPKGVIPFAPDPAGNYFCFDYRMNLDNPSIVFWNHELTGINVEDDDDYNIIDINERNKRHGLECVCSSFAELLDKLYYDESDKKRIRSKVDLYTVLKVSDKWNINFPFAYKLLACRHSSEKLKIKISVESKDIVLERVLSFEDNEWNIENIYNNLKELLPENVYPIVRAEKESYVCLDYRVNKEEPLIVLWKNNEMPIREIYKSCYDFICACGFDKLWYSR